MNLNKMSYPALKEGAYEATFTSHNVIENDKGGYLRVVMTLPNGREITQAYFENQLDYLTGRLREQTSFGDGIAPYEEILDYAVGKEIKFWVYYDLDKDGKNRFNLTYSEPKSDTPKEVEFA